MKILIIEDDQSVAELERDYLEINGGFDCDLYDNGNQGLQAALSQDYALVIVDVMLPGLSGFEICRRLREVKDTPVIIISALADDIDKVRGLGLGACWPLPWDLAGALPLPWVLPGLPDLAACAASGLPGRLGRRRQSGP